MNHDHIESLRESLRAASAMRDAGARGVAELAAAGDTTSETFHRKVGLYRELASEYTQARAELRAAFATVL